MTAIVDSCINKFCQALLVSAVGRGVIPGIILTRLNSMVLSCS